MGTARTESRLQEALDSVKNAGGEGIIVPADLEETDSQGAEKNAQGAEKK